MGQDMTSLSYGSIFCLESQKIDGTEYLRGSTYFAIFLLLLNLEAWNLAGIIPSCISKYTLLVYSVKPPCQTFYDIKMSSQFVLQ